MKTWNIGIYFLNNLNHCILIEEKPIVRSLLKPQTQKLTLGI